MKFRQCIEQIRSIDDSSDLCIDVTIRWNSIFYALKCSKIPTSVSKFTPFL